MFGSVILVIDEFLSDFIFLIPILQWTQLYVLFLYRPKLFFVFIVEKEKSGIIVTQYLQSLYIIDRKNDTMLIGL